MNMKTIRSELTADIIHQPTHEISEKELIETSFFANNEYLIHETGIYKLKSSNPKGSEKVYFWEKISGYYLRPITLLNTVDIDIDDDSTDANRDINTYHVAVEFINIRKEKKQLNIPHDLFADISRSKLIKVGYSLPPDLNTRREIQKAINAALEAGQSQHRRVDGVIVEPTIGFSEAFVRRGWVNHTTHIRESHPRFVGSTMKSRTRRRGEAKVQYDVFKQVLRSSRLACIFTAVAFAGYTKGRIRITSNFSPIYNLFGKRGKGKTTLASIIASIEGAPNKEFGLIRDSQSTYVGLESFLANYTNGFFIIDEIDEFFRNKDAAASRLLAIANNGGRSKFDQDTEATDGKQWNMVIVSTSNAPLEELIKGDIKEGAAQNRIFEFDIEDPEINIFQNTVDSERGDLIEYWLGLLNENYGHLYHDIIDYIVENADKLNENIRTYEAEMKKDPNYLRLKEDNRTIQSIALSMIGADIVGGVIGNEYGELCHQAIEIHKSRFSNIDEPEFDESEYHWEKVDTLKHWINANKGSFLWETYAYEEEPDGISSNNFIMLQKQRAKTLSHNADLKGNVYGIIKLERPMYDSNDFEGHIVLNTAGEEHFKRTFKVDMNDLKISAQALNLLEAKKLGKAKQDKLKIGTRGTFFKLTNRPAIHIDKENTKDLLDNDILKKFSEDNPSSVENIMDYAHSNIDNLQYEEEAMTFDDPDFTPF